MERKKRVYKNSWEKYKAQAPKTHRLICAKCSAEIDFNKDDVLTEWDASGAYPNIYAKSLRCPYCNERNIFEYRDIEGKVHKDIVVKKI